MFYENRVKSSGLRGSFTETDKPRNLKSRLTVKPNKSSSSEFYQSILDSQSSFLRDKALTETNRYSLLKKDYIKIRNNNFKTNREDNSNLMKNSVNFRETDKKNDKIKELFIQIINDQEDGIKSPQELNSPQRRYRNIRSTLKLTEKMNQSINMSNKTSHALAFPDNKISFLNSEQKYKFLNSDSKFQEIIELKKKNAIFKREISYLKNELTGIEDFSLKKIDHNNIESFNEKRVAILKGQIVKQKRYIKNLHKSLRLIKKFYRDMTSILLLFKNLDGKYSDMLKSNDKFLVKRTRVNNRNDFSLLKEIDEKQKNDSLQQVLNTGKNAEVLEKFINNFNEAYEKVKNFERKNEELKKIFDITDVEFINNYKEKVKKIKYNYLLREFIHKYNRYLPIKTLFDLFEPKDKDCIDGQMTKLIKLMRKIEEVFQQISSFEKVKNNAFYSQLSVPEVIRDNMSSFETFLNENQKKINMNLNYQEISNVESSLSLLLRDMINFQINLTTNKEKISLESLMNLQKNLRTNSEKLLGLGVILCENEDSLVLLQKETGSFMNSMANKKKTSENLPFKKNLYKNENICNNDFQKIYSFLHESINDLEESFGHALDDSAKKKLQSFKFYLITLNRLYEQKKITSFLKELDLTMQEQKIDVINKGFDSLKDQIFEKLKAFEEFFQNMNEKVGKLGHNFDMIFENVNEEKKKIVFSLSKKVQNLFKLMAMNIEKKISQKEFNDVNINIASLEEEYKVKIKFIEDKWNSFSKKIKNILETLNHSLK